MDIKIFADGVNIEDFIKFSNDSIIQGFTTNPSLMHQAEITNYIEFARVACAIVKDKPISLEVFSDDFFGMKRQAHILNSLGENVYVKIPITNTKGESTCDVVKYLSDMAIKVNVTAIMTTDQVTNIIKYLNVEVPSYISVFAGRIANTGVDPIPIMKRSVEILETNNSKSELIWASPRELLNVFQANDIGCHIITVTNAILSNLYLIGKDLDEYSLETVRMFHKDALSAGYSI